MEDRFRILRFNRWTCVNRKQGLQCSPSLTKSWHCTWQVVMASLDLKGGCCVHTPGLVSGLVFATHAHRIAMEKGYWVEVYWEHKSWSRVTYPNTCSEGLQSYILSVSFTCTWSYMDGMCCQKDKMAGMGIPTLYSYPPTPGHLCGNS